MRELDRRSRLYQRQQTAFGSAAALRTHRFENDNGSVPALAEAKRYVEHWEEMRQNNIGLLLWGRPGNGKTFAAACIANALCEQWMDVRMTTLATVLEKLPVMSFQDQSRYLDSLRGCDLLILDDFGMERKTNYAQEQVFSIIDGRYLARKPLIVTTNLCTKDLKDPEDMTELRIFDRILELCVPVCFDGPSLRQSKAKEKLALYKELMGR